MMKMLERWVGALAGFVLVVALCIAVSVFDFSKSTIDVLTKVGTVLLIGVAIEVIRVLKAEDKKPPTNPPDESKA